MWPKSAPHVALTDARQVFDSRPTRQPCSRACPPLPTCIQTPRHAPPYSLRLQMRMPELPWHPALASSGLPRSPSALARPAAARLLAMAMAAIAKRQSSSQPPPCPSAASCLAATPPAAPFSFPTSRRASWPPVSPAQFAAAVVPPRLCAPPLPADSGTSLRSSHRASRPP